MTRFTQFLAATALATVVTGANAAATTTQTPEGLDSRVAAATEVLHDLNRIPEQAIPSYLLNRAFAVAVIPNVIKGGFILGGSYGKGIVVVRRADGRWSNPAFITLANINVGFQIGAQGSDLVLVFKSRRGVDDIAGGKFTVGGTAAASAGPVGRTAVAATDGEFKSEIYTYARSRGLFAGITLDGGAITMDQEANAAYYAGSGSGIGGRILADDSIPTPVSARPFIDTLANMAPKLEWQATPSSRSAQAPAPAPADGAKTYAVDESANPAPETVF